MSMTIEISGELEPVLKAEAGKAGIDPIAYTHQLLRASLPPRKLSAPSMSVEESRLLNQINQGFSEEEFERYRELIAKRQAETISPEEFRQCEYCFSQRQFSSDPLAGFTPAPVGAFLLSCRLTGRTPLPPG